MLLVTVLVDSVGEMHLSNEYALFSYTHGINKTQPKQSKFSVSLKVQQSDFVQWEKWLTNEVVGEKDSTSNIFDKPAIV